MRRDTRRSLGAFYTPAELATLVAKWAVDRSGLKILEPSVGSGCLVDAILSRFEVVGAGNIVGYEIDEKTVRELRRFRGNRKVKIRQSDFFDVKAKPAFDLIVANPPFTRNHQLSKLARRAFRKRPEVTEVVHGAPGLWVYFVLVGLRHLRRGGGICFIVPGAVEFADYAAPLLRYVSRLFSKVELITIDDAVDWEGAAQERAAVLLASGYGLGSTSSIDRRRVTIDGSPVGKHAPLNRTIARTTALGDIAKIEIGSVTGANKFFVLSKNEMRAAGLSRNLFKQVVARTKHIQGLTN